MRLRFVTTNPGKVRELRAALGAAFDVEQDARGYPEIQADILEAVARAGAAHLMSQGVPPPFIVEDSGLFIDALRGFPGVYSRYALDTIGLEGVLRLMPDASASRRSARFESCFAYVDDARRAHTFGGTCHGSIAREGVGWQGFGFDPIFVPAGERRTFGEMQPEEKAAFSHRAKAAGLLAAHLKSAKR